MDHHTTDNNTDGIDMYYPPNDQKRRNNSIQIKHKLE